MHAALKIAAIISTLKTAPSYAFTLTDTATTFENTWLANGTTMDRDTSDAHTVASLLQLSDYTDEPEQVLEPGVLITLGAMDIGVYEVHRQQQ